MFKRPVVFVVGAGGSAELNMPVGIGLRDGIAADVSFYFEHPYSEPSRGSAELFRLLRDEFRDKINEYTRAGNRLAPVMRSFNSVDEALHYFSGNEPVVNLGKIAIANRILLAERSSRLPAHDERVRERKVPHDHWTALFLKMALSECRLIDDRPVFENATVITFNYDRTLEHFLFLALQQDAARSEGTSQEEVNRLRIIRPYGSVGPLGWQDRQNGVGFGGQDGQPADIFRAARNLRTFTEQLKDDSIRIDIAEALGAAHLIIVIGFGFHPQNLDLLRAGSRSSPDFQPAVLATTRGIHPANHSGLVEQLSDSMQTPPERVQLFDMPASELLFSLWPSIMRRVG